MLLRIDDTDPARNLPGGEAGDPRGPALARDRLGRGAGAPERPPGALPGGRRGLPARFEGVTLLREDGTRHLPPRERRRRPRLRDHPRASRQRPPAERGAPPRAVARDRRPAPEYIHYGLVLGARRQEALQARRGRLDRLAARGGDPGRGGARLPRGARRCRATTSTSTSSASARSRSRRSPGCPTRSSPRALGVPGRGRAGAARRARPERGARARRARSSSRRRSACPTSARRSSASASCARRRPTCSTRTAAQGDRRASSRRSAGTCAPCAGAHRAPTAGPSSGRCSPRCRATRRCGGSMRLFDTYSKSLVELPAPPGPGAACTSAGRRSTRAPTSATRGRSCSACGCAPGCARAATT